MWNKTIKIVFLIMEDGSLPGIAPSVLDLLNRQSETQTDKRLKNFLTSDVLARDRFILFGVPLGVDSERLRFRNWKVKHKEQDNALAFARWSSSGQQICLLSHGQLRLVNGLDPSTRTTVPLPLTAGGSRARWINQDAEVIVCSGASRRVVSVQAESTVVQTYDCGAMTALQDCAGCGPLLFGGARDGALYVWDRREGERVRRVAGSRGSGGIGCLDVSRDGQLLVAASTLVDVWDARKMGKPVVSFSQQHLGFGALSGTSSLSAIQLEPDSNSRLAVQAADGCCSIFDLVSQTFANILTASDDAKPSEAGISFMPNAPWVAVASGSRIRLLSTARKKNSRGCSLELSNPVLALSCSEANGLAIATRGALILFGEAVTDEAL